jgi:hypothetical protein
MLRALAFNIESPSQPSNRVPQTRVDPLAQMPERDVARPSMARVVPDQPSRIPKPSTAAGENAARQDIPLDWVRGV